MARSSYATPYGFGPQQSSSLVCTEMASASIAASVPVRGFLQYVRDRHANRDVEFADLNMP